MNKIKSQLLRASRALFVLTVLASWTLAATSANGQVVHADYDFEASGFVVPADANLDRLGGGLPSSVAQVGYYPSGGGSGASCDTGGCDSGGCLSGAGGGVGGILGQMSGGGSSLCGGCGRQGCGLCGGLSNLRNSCIFCRGTGCSACQLLKGQGGQGGIFGGGSLLSGMFGALGSLAPNTEGGLCRQRWYDLSAEAMFLGHNTNFSGGVNALTSRGVSGPTVLSLSDIDGGDLEAGFRLSGALMFGGAGSNIEATWVGEHEWSGEQVVRDAGAGLFSFISEFGTLPLNGFDDTDRSLQQKARSNSEYDSVEINYRRRAVWPYCRFQSSWLVGLRYIRYDDGLRYEALGQNNNTVNSNLPRFFGSDDQTQNKMFGAQVGGDFWWNINPGISLGIGAKLGILKNDMDRVSVMRANSLNTLATPGTVALTSGDHDTTAMGEFEAKLVYRLSHSWAARVSYHVVGVEDVAFSGIDVNAVRQFVTGNPIGDSTTTGFDSLIVQGFSVGAEYMW